MPGGGSIQLVRISGIRIGVSPSWFVVLFVLIWILSGYFHDVLGGSQTRGFLVARSSLVVSARSISVPLGPVHRPTRLPRSQPVHTRQAQARRNGTDRLHLFGSKRLRTS